MPVVHEHDLRLVPVVAVRQNVYPIKGKGLAVHGGKSAMALRIVPLPELVVNCLRARSHPEFDPSWPVFASAGRDGVPTYRWPPTFAATSAPSVNTLPRLDDTPHLRDDPRRRDDFDRPRES